MSTSMPWFKSFSAFLHHFVLTKLAISSIRVKFLAYLKLDLNLGSLAEVCDNKQPVVKGKENQ